MAGFDKRVASYEEALAGYDRAIALDAADVEAWVGRAMALQTMQRFDEGFAMLDRAQQLQPDYPPAISARGVLLCEQSRFAEGFAAQRRYADFLWREKPTRASDDPPQKKRHDQEQDAWRNDQSRNRSRRGAMAHARRSPSTRKRHSEPGGECTRCYA